MDKSLYFHQVLTHYFILFLNQKIPPKTRMAVENGRLHQIWPWKAVATKQDHSQPINFHRGTNGGPLHQHRSAALVHQEKSRDGGEYVDHTCWGIILGVSPGNQQKRRNQNLPGTSEIWIESRFDSSFLLVQSTSVWCWNISMATMWTLHLEALYLMHWRYYFPLLKVRI